MRHFLISITNNRAGELSLKKGKLICNVEKYKHDIKIVGNHPPEVANMIAHSTHEIENMSTRKMNLESQLNKVEFPENIKIDLLNYF